MSHYQVADQAGGPPPLVDAAQVVVVLLHEVALLRDLRVDPLQLGQLLRHAARAEGVQLLAELGQEVVVHLVVGSQDLLQQVTGFCAYFIPLE